MEEALKTYCNSEVPKDWLIAYVVWWWCVSWKLNVIRHKLFSIFDFFQRGIKLYSLYANLFPSYICSSDVILVMLVCNQLMAKCISKIKRIRTYCHVTMCDNRRSLDLLLDLLDNLISSWLHFTFCYYTHAHTSVHCHVFTAISLQLLPTADVPLPLGSRTVPDLSYQLLTATAHNDWALAVLWLTHQKLIPNHRLTPY
jgi:hypothetical protein